MDKPEPHQPRGNRPVGFAILTTTDSRNEKEDESGRALREIVAKGGHRVVRRALCSNSLIKIQERIREWLRDPEVEVIITCGGTGFGERDVTVNALQSLGGTIGPGFGERFRSLSYDQVGNLAMMSRSEMFIIDGRPVFALPGSPKACRLAAEEIILPFVPHLVAQLTGR